MKLRPSAWAPLRNLDINHALLLPILFHCVDDQGRPMLGPPRKGPETEQSSRIAYKDIPAVVEEMRHASKPDRSRQADVETRTAYNFIHVSDLANAHVLAMRYLIRGGRTRVFNLGIGRGYSVREVIAAAERISGRSAPIKVLPRHAADPPTLLADATLARNVLGFAPVFTDLEQMISHAWAWRKKAAVAYQL